MATRTPRPVAFDLLRRSEHVLFAVLLAVGVGSSWSAGSRWLLLVGAILVGGWYALGVMVARTTRAPRLALPWLVVLTLGCAGLAVGSVGFVWLAFPIFLLCTQLLPLTAAIPAVVAVTLGTIVRIALTRDRWDAGVVVGPLIGATVAVVITVVYRDLAEQTRQRSALIEQLTATRDELAAAERRAGMLAERERLARELHDTITQDLTSVVLMLRTARDLDAEGSPRLRDRLDTAVDAAQGVLTETRRMVQALTPAELSGRSLPEALEKVVGGDSAVPAALHLEGEPRPVPTSVAVALIRASQEALANVGRHSRASRAEVTLTYLPEAISLDIVDDGVGFDPGQPLGPTTGTGLGLPGLRARIAELDGTVQVDSAPDHGTAVNITVPGREALR